MKPNKHKNKDIIDHIAIVVKDIDSSLSFYTKQFGCDILYSDSTCAILQFENIKLSLVSKNQHPAHIAIINDSIINDKNAIKHRDNSISKYIKDYDGNYIELITYKK